MNYVFLPCYKTFSKLLTSLKHWKLNIINLKMGNKKYFIKKKTNRVWLIQIKRKKIQQVIFYVALFNKFHILLSFFQYLLRIYLVQFPVIISEIETLSHPIEWYPNSKLQSNIEGENILNRIVHLMLPERKDRILRKRFHTNTITLTLKKCPW